LPVCGENIIEVWRRRWQDTVKELFNGRATRLGVDDRLAPGTDPERSHRTTDHSIREFKSYPSSRA